MTNRLRSKRSSGGNKGETNFVEVYIESCRDEDLEQALAHYHRAMENYQRIVDCRRDDSTFPPVNFEREMTRLQQYVVALQRLKGFKSNDRSKRKDS